MISPKLKIPLFAVSVLACAAFATATGAPAKSNTGAVVAGVIVGAAVGAAVSSNIKHKNKIYVQGPPSSRPQAFSPKPGVWCYPNQRACYNANGAYAPNWTYKVYAR